MKRNAKTSLALSFVALILCFTMLIGTTFAWFTDSVTSAGNIIQSGILDVTFEWMNGTEDPATGTWTDASTGAIFNYDNWEPGYTEVRHVKIGNEGTLALKYKVTVIATGTVSSLSDVIDVYYLDPAQQVTDRAELPEANRIGTLTEVLSGMKETAYGELLAGEKTTLTIALKMQEEAGNVYQETSIGSDFAVQLFATQLTYEEDSFDDQYDKDAQYNIYPVSSVEELLDHLAIAESGDNLVLTAGEFVLDSTLTIPSGVSIKGAQAGTPASEWINDAAAEKTVIKYAGTSGNVLQILQTSEDVEEAVSDITIDGVVIDGNNTASKGIYVKKSDGEAIEGIKIVNTAVINSANDGIDVRNAYGAIIENNYVENVKDTAITLGNYNGYHYETWAEVTARVCNNVIKNVTGSENGAIFLENGMGDVIVSGNTIDGVVAVGAVGSSPIRASGITVYDVYEGGVITVEDNAISNADQGIAVYKYTYSTVYGEDWWEGPTSDNDGVIIENNKISDFTVFGIATSNLNAKSTANATTVDIIGNELVSTATDNALQIGTEKSNWTVTATANTFNGAVLETVVAQ